MKSPGVERTQARLRSLAELATRVAEEMAGEVAEVAALAAEAVLAGRKLMFCGNGGSAADAQHLATEYVVRFRDDRPALPALALTTDTSLLTAGANDLGFERVFARQVDALGEPGDVLFLHSTSGSSPNLLRAAEVARERGVKTVAMLAKGGGELRGMVDIAVVLPTDAGAHAQELQLAIGHIICELVEERYHADRSEG
jgi:D-sedoheptulose 7-phosphate isomerase